MNKKAPVFKNISSTSLYNLTQDQQHLVILDARKVPNFLSMFIRKSYSLRNEKNENMESLINFIEKNNSIFSKLEEKKSKTQKKKNNAKPKRKLVLIFESPEDEKFAMNVVDRLFLQNLFTNFYKFNKMEDFQTNFGFLCIKIKANELFDFLKNINKSKVELKKEEICLSLNPNESKISYLENADQIDKILSFCNYPKIPFETLNQFIFSTKSVPILFANSEFPLKIQKTGVFFGTRFNLNSPQQLSALKITKFVECFLIKEDPSKTEIYTTNSGMKILRIYVNPDKFIDFDAINEKIKEYRSDMSHILFVKDNYKVSQGMMLAYNMVLEKQTLTLLSLRVFSVLGEADCEGRVYNQLMNYVPGQVKKLF